MKKIRQFFFALICLTISLAPLHAQWVQSGLSGQIIASFALSGTNLFAGTGGGGVFLSTDNGTNWTAVNTGLTNPFVMALAVSGTNLFAWTWGGVFISSDNGTSWTEVNTGLTNFAVRSLAVSGTNLFAGTDGGGVFLSTNNGTSWTAVNTGLTNLAVSSLAVSGTNLFAGTDGGGVFLSTNNGTSWTAVNTGLTNTAVISLAVSGTNLFAGTWGGGIFLSSDNGTSWTAVNTGLTNRTVWSLAVSGTNLFAGTNGGGVFLSTNNGTNWTEINTSLTNLTVYSLVAVSGTHLFAGTDGGGVWRRSLLEMILPILNVPYTQTFDAATLPAGWTQSFAGGLTSNRWSVSNTNNAGGTPHELRARIQDQVGTSRLIAGRFNTAGMTALSLSFRMFYDDFGAGCTMKIQSSADGITWTDEAFSFASGSGNRGPEVVNTTIVNNVGAETFIAWVIDGDHSQFDNWYIDNVEVRLPNVGTGVGNNLPENATVVYFANGTLHMQFATEERNRLLQVIDISGRVVLSKSLHGLGNMVSVPLQIDNGVYIVRITGETSAISRRILVR